MDNSTAEGLKPRSSTKATTTTTAKNPGGKATGFRKTANGCAGSSRQQGGRKLTTRLTGSQRVHTWVERGLLALNKAPLVHESVLQHHPLSNAQRWSREWYARARAVRNVAARVQRKPGFPLPSAVPESLETPLKWTTQPFLSKSYSTPCFTVETSF